MRRSRVESMPEAGKPEGLCEECGAHGNRGRVTLLYSTVECHDCASRADDVAYRRARELLAEIEAEAKSEGLEIQEPHFAFELDTNGSTWGRVARARARVVAKRCEVVIKIGASAMAPPEESPNKDTPEAEALLGVMHDISEDEFAAGWLIDLEFVLWSSVVRDGRWPQRWSINHSDLLRYLAHAAGGWWIWGGPEGRTFLPLEVWERRYSTREPA